MSSKKKCLYHEPKPCGPCSNNIESRLVITSEWLVLDDARTFQQSPLLRALTADRVAGSQNTSMLACWHCEILLGLTRQDSSGEEMALHSYHSNMRIWLKKSQYIAWYPGKKANDRKFHRVLDGRQPQYASRTRTPFQTLVDQPENCKTKSSFLPTHYPSAQTFSLKGK